MSEILFFVGTFTDGRPYFDGATGAGIITCVLDTATGRIEYRHTYRNILNPDYIAYDARRQRLFSIADDLTAAGKVVAFRVADNGELKLLGDKSSRAPVTCHICVSDEEVYTASYVESCLTAHAITNSGIGELRREFRYQGTGPNKARQEASHAHQSIIAPDGRQLFVCDLGSDKLWIHRIENGRIAAAAPTFFQMSAGCGPRHMVFHATLPVAYLLAELTGNVIVFNWHTGQILADLPAGAASAAAIRLHGATLFASNRTDHTIAQFKLDEAGLPAFAGRFDVGGKCPRDFNIAPTGRWLVAGCQESHQLAVHELTSDGLYAGQKPQLFPLQTPVCIVFGGAP